MQCITTAIATAAKETAAMTREMSQIISISPFNVDKLIILSNSKRLQYLKVFRCNCNRPVSLRISRDIYRKTDTKINALNWLQFIYFWKFFTFVYFGWDFGPIVELFHLHLVFFPCLPFALHLRLELKEKSMSNTLSSPSLRYFAIQRI